MQTEQVQPQPALEIQQGAEHHHQQGEQQGTASGENAQPQPHKEQAPCPPQHDKRPGNPHTCHFACQGRNHPEPCVVDQDVSVRKNDGPRAGDQFTKAGVPDGVVRVLIDPFPPSGQGHQGDERGQDKKRGAVKQGKSGKRFPFRRFFPPLRRQPQPRGHQGRKGDGGIPVHPPGHEYQDGQQKPRAGIPFQRGYVESSFRARIIGGGGRHLPRTLMCPPEGGKDETCSTERRGVPCWAWWQKCLRSFSALPGERSISCWPAYE